MSLLQREKWRGHSLLKAQTEEKCLALSDNQSTLLIVRWNTDFPDIYYHYPSEMKRKWDPWPPVALRMTSCRRQSCLVTSKQNSPSLFKRLFIGVLSWSSLMLHPWFFQLFFLKNRGFERVTHHLLISKASKNYSGYKSFSPKGFFFFSGRQPKLFIFRVGPWHNQMGAFFVKSLPDMAIFSHEYQP